MFLWLAFFLLDVAVRRLALDIRAMSRKAASFLISIVRHEHKADETLKRLRLKRKQIINVGWGSTTPIRQAEPSASKRYEADEKFDGELPMSPVTPPVKEAGMGSTQPAQKEGQKPTKTEGDTSHIERLLRAKHKAADPHKNTNAQDDK